MPNTTAQTEGKFATYKLTPLSSAWQSLFDSGMWTTTPTT